ncbi:MAG: GTPase Era [Actinomycetota bacterium]
MSGFRSGIVAVVGRPNVGKSTLGNSLVGQKVAIVSDKPQTTRADIRAILTTDDAQVVFTDTPGFHKPRTLLGSRLNELVADAVDGVDVVVMVVDGSAGVGRGDAFVYERQVASSHAARFCVVNKEDAFARVKMLPQLEAAQALGEWDEIVPVSAARGDGVDGLRELIIARLPEGLALFPEGEVTDQPVETRVAELIREQALHVTREEVPHSVAIEIDEMEREGDLTRIHASIVVERDSQKGILIGKAGATLKTIGTNARAGIELLLGTKVYLDLHVKVMKEWQRDPKALNRLGY